MLHTINKSPFDRNSLDSCLRLATKGSSVLMIEDGIYGALKKTAKSGLVEKAMTDIKFYVLGPDLKARGIKQEKLIDGIEIVDYTGFVKLVADHDTNHSWL
jgi:tRNA 2-thiouridine synthesizing protein B